MNLPENTFIFNMFVYVQHKLLLIFTLTDVYTDNFRANAANLSQ